MRALVQRVSRAAVRFDGATTGAIGPGLLVLLGITHADDEATCDRLADKVRALRVFADPDGRMNEPLGDREVLVVSQFTLYGDASRRRRPCPTGGGPIACATSSSARACASSPTRAPSSASPATSRGSPTARG